MTLAESQEQVSLRIGLIVNPLAGLGGSLGLKGSDDIAAAGVGPEILGSQRSAERAKRALAPLCEYATQLSFACWGDKMGEAVLTSLGLKSEVLGSCDNTYSSAQDTRLAAQAMAAAGVDIIVFVGGDGTARDIYDAVGETFPVLGIPAGVKMHSGVFAVSPEAAGELLVELVKGGLVGLAPQEVRDIDEQAFRQDIVRSQFYGEMQVPAEGRFLQHTKIGGVENAELAAADIAAWVVESMDKGCIYIIGPGSTTAAIMDELRLPNTLLGVDVVRDNTLLLADANEQGLLGLLAETKGRPRIIVTAIGGQGHVFGRGNQQISAKVIRLVGVANINIVAAKSKISALQGRPLLLDTNDPDLDIELSGYRPVITGYQDQILYRLATMA
ncbi:MAG: ATP-NAD kinase family protein [Proteobacteria bacterium]|nr:ATP-NAD kinase family protein [Pseudomonadota bacterium]